MYLNCDESIKVYSELEDAIVKAVRGLYDGGFEDYSKMMLDWGNTLFENEKFADESECKSQITFL